MPSPVFRTQLVSCMLKTEADSWSCYLMRERVRWSGQREFPAGRHQQGPPTLGSVIDTFILQLCRRHFLTPHFIGKESTLCRHLPKDLKLPHGKALFEGRSQTSISEISRLGCRARGLGPNPGSAAILTVKL